MKLSFKYKQKFNDKTLAIIEELSFHTTKLYNIANYNNRENEFNNYIDTDKKHSGNWHKLFI
jgi:hypothetical protein